MRLQAVTGIGHLWRSVRRWGLTGGATPPHSGDSSMQAADVRRKFVSPPFEQLSTRDVGFNVLRRADMVVGGAIALHLRTGARLLLGRGPDRPAWGNPSAILREAVRGGRAIGSNQGGRGLTSVARLLRGRWSILLQARVFVRVRVIQEAIRQLFHVKGTELLRVGRSRVLVAELIVQQAGSGKGGGIPGTKCWPRHASLPQPGSILPHQLAGSNNEEGRHHGQGHGNAAAAVPGGCRTARQVGAAASPAAQPTGVPVGPGPARGTRPAAPANPSRGGLGGSVSPKDAPPPTPRPSRDGNEEGDHQSKRKRSRKVPGLSARGHLVPISPGVRISGSLRPPRAVASCMTDAFLRPAGGLHRQERHRGSATNVESLGPSALLIRRIGKVWSADVTTAHDLRGHGPDGVAVHPRFTKNATRIKTHAAGRPTAVSNPRRRPSRPVPRRPGAVDPRHQKGRQEQEEETAAVRSARAAYPLWRPPAATNTG